MNVFRRNLIVILINELGECCLYVNTCRDKLKKNQKNIVYQVSVSVFSPDYSCWHMFVFQDATKLEIGYSG